MGIRETINKKSGLTTGVIIGVIVLALAAIVWELSPKSAGKLGVQIYFSDDGGKTFYEDSMANLAPYTHNGNEADVAHVYQCGTNPPFVAWLEKYTPDMKATLTPVDHPDVDQDAGTLVQRPGDKDWVIKNTSEGRAIVTEIKPPAGQSGIPVPVIPGLPAAQ